MAFAAPNLLYASGQYDSAVACSLPIFSAPFAGVNTDYILEQDYVCNINSYTSLALNTSHPDYPDFLLTGEGPRRDQAGGMQRWTRTYAKFPATYSQPSGVVYNYIGYLTTDTPAIVGRNRINNSAAVSRSAV